MMLGDKKINCVKIRLNDNFSVSISDLGRGSDSLLEGLLLDNRSRQFVGEPFHFKKLDSLVDFAREFANDIEEIKNVINK